jgi:hypothetical protein
VDLSGEIRVNISGATLFQIGTVVRAFKIDSVNSGSWPTFNLLPTHGRMLRDLGYRRQGMIEAFHG